MYNPSNCYIGSSTSSAPTFSPIYTDLDTFTFTNAHFDDAHIKRTLGLHLLLHQVLGITEEFHFPYKVVFLSSL